MPIEPRFIHLHVNTSYSILRSTIKTDSLLAAVKKLNMPAVAMTDINNLFGAFEFSDHATAEKFGYGIQPIIGCEIALKNPYDESKNDFVILLVIDEDGFANLRRLDSKLFLRKLADDDPNCGEQFITFEELKTNSAGLMLLTGSVKGPLYRMFNDGKADDAEKLLCDLNEIFKGRLYIELERHDLPQEKVAEPFLIDMAYKYDLPLVATNSVMFLDESYYDAHEAMLCIGEKRVLEDPEHPQSNLNYRLKSAEEMEELFADIPEAIINTVNIAKRSHFMLKKINPVLPKISDNENEQLRRDAREGLDMRLRQVQPVAPREEYLKRLEYELDTIISMGFAGYFLIVADFINWSKNNGVPVGPGRGSGAGSMVAWSIRITDLDPFRFGLLFERFLNPERVNMPDFDVDFCKEGRERTIAYVCKKYGADRVAQIITYGQMKAKAVVRDVGRVIGMSYNAVDKIAKMIPNTYKNEKGDKKEITLGKALELVPELKEKVENDEQIGHLFDIAFKLEGLHRNSGMHAAGIVIGNKSLEEIVPLYKDPDSDMPVAQFNMKYIESTSLVKFDFLGLKTLTLLRDTVRLIGKDYNFLSVIPVDDADTYKMLSNGDTVAVFQFESGGMKQVLQNMKPDRIDDLVAVVSLYRPGPMDNIPSYIARKHGREKIDYIYPSLEPILKETYGIIIYQEQVMQISQVMAGYSLGGADLLRRAMGKKIQAEMDKQEPIFVNGAAEKGVPSEVANKVFSLMKEFAKYGFNKSHAAAYAWVAYQTAYLKCHYRLEFMCASMSSEKGDTDKLSLFRGDCEKAGIKVLPPCVNHSYNDFMPEDGKIRYALSAIKGMGEGAGISIERVRLEGGEFRSLSDFLRRIDTRVVNRKAMENMIKAGAFDCFDNDRAKLLFNLDAMMEYSAKIMMENNSSQISFFGMDTGSSDFELKENPVKTGTVMSSLEKLEEEKSVIGFFLSDHPLKTFETSLKRLRADRTSDIAKTLKISPDGARFRLGVIVTGSKKGITKTGKPYRIISFSDMYGECDVFCWDEVYQDAKEMLEGREPLFITVSGQMGDGEKEKLTLYLVEKLSDVSSRSTSCVIINIKDNSVLDTVNEVLINTAEGSTLVIIGRVIKYADKDLKVEIPLKKHYHLTSDSLDRLRYLNNVEIEEL